MLVVPSRCNSSLWVCVSACSATHFEIRANKNDQFDLSEASLAVALTMMGVTALIKRWWMFWMAMIPAAFALFMGAAGFAGVDTNNPVVRSIIQVLS
jgi:Domain of unknown function (DUF4337)